jgi:hypothetical protein
LVNEFEEWKENCIKVAWDKEIYSTNKINHHAAAHEIHHIGQHSVLSRELEFFQTSLEERQMEAIDFYSSVVDYLVYLSQKVFPLQKNRIRGSQPALSYLGSITNFHRSIHHIH